MSTVPGPDTPAPANNAKTLLLSSDPGLYARPTAGGNASGDANVPAGPTPGYSISLAGNAPTNAGPDMGHGATQILSGISGGGDADNDGDTV